MSRREINRRAAENFISSAPFPIFGVRAAIRHEGSRRAGVRGHHTVIALLSVRWRFVLDSASLRPERWQARTKNSQRIHKSISRTCRLVIVTHDDASQT